MATILTAGAVVGVVDGIFALVVQHVYLGRSAPLRIFQGIASGLMGPDAFAAGASGTALGLALHFGFATFWAALFMLGASGSTTVHRLVRERAAIVGVAFGALVWLAMNYAVKPLGGIEPTPVTTRMFAIMILGHTVMVGLPIALIVRARTLAGPGTRRVAG